MFTPPPSPSPAASASNFQPVIVSGSKARIGRRLRWTAILGPVILAVITLSTRYITHPAWFDILSNSASLSWDWTPHKRHLSARSDSSSSSTPTPSTASSAGTTTSTTAQSIPTVPTSATVPNPFPQPWDSNFSQNFSSNSCFNFFTNMTNALSFRACRPLSLLLQTSTALVEAQQNLTLLNSIIWGTCTTSINHEQCSANMGWFAQTLQNQCVQDLSDNDVNVVNALIGLQAYDLMYNVGCLSDPTTNTYCYLNAVHNPNPSDVYIYQLPLGLAFPSTSTPTCSTCAKSVLAIYVSAIENISTSVSLSSLATNYPSAQQPADLTCGSNYAKAVASGSSKLWHTSPWSHLLLATIYLWLSL